MATNNKAVEAGLRAAQMLIRNRAWGEAVIRLAIEVARPHIITEFIDELTEKDLADLIADSTAEGTWTKFRRQLKKIAAPDGG